MMKRVLHLPLKKIYFDQIKAGTKTEEYRLQNEYWAKRLEDREYDEIHIKLGYPKADDSERIIVLPWLGVTKKTIEHEHFGGLAHVYAIKVDVLA